MMASSSAPPGKFSSCYEKFKVPGSKFKVDGAACAVGAGSKSILILSMVRNRKTATSVLADGLKPAPTLPFFIIYGWPQAHEELL
jgi:hypothetical protein